MITPRATRANYALIKDQLPFVVRRIRETLLTFADSRGYAIAGREKTLESIAEKIETGRFSSWSEIDDIVAFAIIVPTVGHEEETLVFLRAAFTELKTIPRGATKKAPEVFRFECTRFLGTLRRPEDVPETEQIYKLPFEIQLRTAFEHAWSVTTHSLTYKSPTVSWERLRLSSQLRANVEAMDLLIAGFENQATIVPRSSWPDVEAREAVAASFQDLFSRGLLPEELSPKDWTRFAESVCAMLKGAKGLRGDALVGRVRAAMGAIHNSVLSETAIPLSLSLTQFVFATLFNAGVISLPLAEYTPLITEEMEELYPNLSAVRARFRFDL